MANYSYKSLNLTQVKNLDLVLSIICQERLGIYEVIR